MRRETLKMVSKRRLDDSGDELALTTVRNDESGMERNSNLKQTQMSDREFRAAQDVLAKILEATDDYDRLIHIVFKTIPSKREVPDYLDVIKNPIALDIIRRRVSHREYADLEEFVSDIKLLVQNAQTYNEEGSQIYEDSRQIEEIAQKALITFRKRVPRRYSEEKKTPLKKISLPALASSNTPEYDRKTAWKNLELEIVDLLKTHVDATKRPISELFWELPSKRDYPDYYNIIHEPLCLNEVERRVRRNYYPDFAAFERDIRLIFSNAQTYNSDESQVFHDALTLSTVFDDKVKQAVKSGRLKQEDQGRTFKLKLVNPAQKQVKVEDEKPKLQEQRFSPSATLRSSASATTIQTPSVNSDLANSKLPLNSHITATTYPKRLIEPIFSPPRTSLLELVRVCAHLNNGQDTEHDLWSQVPKNGRQTHVLTIPTMLPRIHVYARIAQYVLARSFTLIMTANNRKITPLDRLPPNAPFETKNSTSTTCFEIALSPGINYIECSVAMLEDPSRGVKEIFGSYIVRC